MIRTIEREQCGHRPPWSRSTILLEIACSRSSRHGLPSNPRTPTSRPCWNARNGNAQPCAVHRERTCRKSGVSIVQLKPKPRSLTSGTSGTCTASAPLIVFDPEKMEATAVAGELMSTKCSRIRLFSARPWLKLSDHCRCCPKAESLRHRIGLSFDVGVRVSLVYASSSIATSGRSDTLWSISRYCRRIPLILFLSVHFADEIDQYPVTGSGSVRRSRADDTSGYNLLADQASAAGATERYEKRHFNKHHFRSLSLLACGLTPG